MINSLKSELKKIYTLRSTYVIFFLGFLSMMLFDFFIVGYRALDHHLRDASISFHSPYYLYSHIGSSDGIGLVVVLGSIVSVLLIAHEYRYNTIMYTLTSSNSRNKTILAKLLAVSLFAVVYALFIEILAPSLAVLGLHAHHLSATGQIFFFKQYFIRVLFYTWAYSVIGLILTVFFRNLVASVVSLFVLPLFVEPLIGQLLSSNQQQYLPFTALGAAVDNGIVISNPGELSALKSALIVLVYIAVFGALAWISFLRRDAN